MIFFKILVMWPNYLFKMAVDVSVQVSGAPRYSPGLEKLIVIKFDGFLRCLMIFDTINFAYIVK